MATLATLIVNIEANTAQLVSGAQQTAQSMGKIEDASTSLNSKLGQLSEMIVGAFAIQHIVAFGREMLALGDEIIRGAEAASITTDEFQKLQYISSQTSVSVEGMVGAIQNLEVRLGKGDKGAVGALAELRINLQDFLALDPYQQFVTLSEAIGKIEDPTKRAQLAAEVFGKSWKEIAPAIAEDIRAMGDSAPVMSEQMVRSLDQAGDALEGLKLRMRVWGADVIELFTHTFDGVVLIFYPMIANILEGLSKFYAALLKIPGAGKVFPTLTADMKGLADATQWLRDATTAQGLQMDKAAESARKAHAPLVNLTVASHAAADAHEAHAAAAKTVVEQLSPEMAHALELAAIAHQHEVAALQMEEAQFKSSQRAAEEYIKHLPTAKLVGIPGTRNLPSIGDVPVDVGAGNLAHVPELAKKATEGIHELAAAFQQLAQIGGSSFGPIMQGIGSVISGLSAAQKSNDRWGGSAGVASAMFSDEASATDKWAAALASGAAIASGAMEVWNATANAGSKAAGALHGAMAGAKAGAAFGPWGAAIGGAAGALVGFIRNMGAGRKAVEDFGKQFGGLDELHQKMLALGDAGEQMWIKLTQHTDKGDLKGAQAQIEAIQAALAKIPPSQAAMAESAGYQTTAQLHKAADDAVKLWQFMKDSGEYTASAVADAWAKAQDAMKNSGDSQVSTIQTSLDAAKSALSGLDSEIASLQASINSEAPEEVMGVVEAQARARLSALQEERDAAAQHVTDLQDQLIESINRVADAINNIPKQISIGVETHPTGGGSGGSDDGRPGFASGTSNLDYQSFGRRSRVNLHGDEAVIPKNGAGTFAGQVASMVAAALGGSGGEITLSAPQLADFFNGKAVKAARKAAATGMLRPAAAAGRSY